MIDRRGALKLVPVAIGTGVALAASAEARSRRPEDVRTAYPDKPPVDWIHVGHLCGEDVIIPTWDTSALGVADAMALFMAHFKAVFFTIERSEP